MIEVKTGNLLEADAEALVNTVNCVGVMGKGIALQFKRAFPANTRAYERACRAGELHPGKVLVVPTENVVNPKYIINFPTKQHWKGNSKIPFIKAGLADLVAVIKHLGIKSIAIPPLGCGNGGLDWSEVYPIIKAAIADLDIRALVYAPSSAPEAAAMPVATKRPNMTRGRALLIKLIEQYCQPGYRLSLLEIQKLAYFLQEAGEPLKLAFVKEKFGPYAENLNFVLQNIEGHFIRGYGDRTIRSEVALIDECIAEANAFLARDSEATDRLTQVGELIRGFETPYGLELLATVHWVAKRDMPLATDADFAISKVHSWNARKAKVFSEEHIRKAWTRLMVGRG